MSLYPVQKYISVSFILNPVPKSWSRDNGITRSVKKRHSLDRVRNVPVTGDLLGEVQILSVFTEV